jgi:hypothetical protein
MTGFLFVTEPLNPNCMLGPYDTYERGTPEWAEALAGHIKMHYQHATRTRDADFLVRDLREALRERPYPWDVWPDVANPDGHAWLDRLLVESGWHAHLCAVLSKIDPGLHATIAGLIAQVEAEVRTPGAPIGNQNAARPPEVETTVRDTHGCSEPEPRDGHATTGIRRRLQKRANQGDALAQELVAQLASNAISPNRAAIQAGMRAEYIRIPKGDPVRAAARIRERLGDAFAEALAAALNC